MGKQQDRNSRAHNQTAKDDAAVSGEENTSTVDVKASEENTVTEPAPAVVAPAPTPVAAPAPDVKKPVTDLKKDVAGVVTLKTQVLMMFKEYAEMMQLSRPQTTASTAQGALKLADAVSNLLRVPGELYQDAMNDVIKFIREHRGGVFHDMYVFRGFMALHGRLGKNRTTIITEVMSTLLTAADSASVAEASGRVSIPMVVGHFTDQEQADRFAAYFNRK